MKEKSVQVTGEKRSGKWKAVFARSEVTVILAVIVLGICFAAMSDGFFTAYNLFNISRTASIYVFIALAQDVYKRQDRDGGFLLSGQQKIHLIRAQTNRFFYKYGPALFHGRNGIFRMKVGGQADIDHIHIRLFDQVHSLPIGLRGKFLSGS